MTLLLFCEERILWCIVLPTFEIIVNGSSRSTSKCTPLLNSRQLLPTVYEWSEVQEWWWSGYRSLFLLVQKRDIPRCLFYSTVALLLWELCFGLGALDINSSAKIFNTFASSCITSLVWRKHKQHTTRRTTGRSECNQKITLYLLLFTYSIVIAAWYCSPTYHHHASTDSTVDACFSLTLYNVR